MTIDDPRARREIRFDGARIVYAEAGSGEPVVFFHGYPQSRLCWRHPFDAVARTHRAIAPDWIGWGESDRPLDVSLLYDDEVERMGRFLDAVGAPRANLMVHDYGGHLGLGFAARHPERVLRLGVFNSRAHRTFPLAGRLLFGAIGALARAPGAPLAYLPLEATHRALLAKYVRLGCFDEPLLAKYLGWMSEPHGRRFFVRFFQDYALREPGITEGLAKVTAPTTIVWGDRDPYCPPWIADELARILPDAEIRHLADADHYVMEERPAEVLAAITALLARLPHRPVKPDSISSTSSS